MTVTAGAKLRQIAEESGSDPVGAVLRAVGTCPDITRPISSCW